jgi:hypothetical protein
LTGSCQGNTAIGHASMCGATTAQFNTAVGWCSLFCSTNSTYNTTLGWYSGYCVTSGSCNVLIGPYAVPTNPTDSCQLRIGFGSNLYWLCGDNTKAIQPAAGVRDCAGSTGTAGQVLLSNGANAICWGPAPAGSAATPIALGSFYGCVGTTNNNVSAGFNALRAVTSGPLNTAVGRDALCALTTGSCNVALGGQALQLANGFLNVAVGAQSLALTTTGSCNTAVGFCSGYSITGGGANTLLGSYAGYLLTAGTQNTFVGYNSGPGVCTGSFNVALGLAAGLSIGTGCCNVAIGFNATVPAANGSCQLVIGYSSSCNWLTGCANRAIRPGAGIMDCTGSTGGLNHALLSNGANAIRWSNISVPIECCVTIPGSTTCLITFCNTPAIGLGGTFCVAAFNGTGNCAGLATYTWVKASSIATSVLLDSQAGFSLVALDTNVSPPNATAGVCLRNNASSATCVRVLYAFV